MLYPTIEELTKGKYNRYELALATAKCARLITDEYIIKSTIVLYIIVSQKTSISRRIFWLLFLHYQSCCFPHCRRFLWKWYI